VYNIHYGKRDIGTTRITTLAIDQGRIEQAADIIDFKYSQEGKENSRWELGMG